MGKNIPVKAAKEIVDKYALDQVIFVAYSKERNKTFVTTYGKTEIDCDQACQGGNWLKKNMLIWPHEHCLIEPNRVKKLKARIKELESEKLQAATAVKGSDA